ncbi:MAG TPA: tRNA (adenosine(37)-N6)-threonylcarbamoyltransferase complex ATPase subunit type 1 TsaE, partial [Candidatus Nanoarchaeia archaeon]|nr:tRNA (adenosine(37)-N6)-threonylcarbamoyltransferase complex ATPase subunit type 1 TsaE [Candidatus Nanoarchaeia archaeon]
MGERIGRALKGGQVIELVSDLGGGKTVLVKGMAQGLGYKGDVTSPTFTISRVYQVRPGLELHHFDFYRLGRGDIVAQELEEVINDSEVIVAIEWAENAGP